jgi:uncharacterized repeat protein (TIGR01451 family)/MYXO-CTERM domain-containing protein
VRTFLGFPTHFFAECQAVNAFENLNPHGFFLTTTGFAIDSRPNFVDVLHADEPFVQFDGTFGTVGGSEPSYSIPAGGAYKAGDVVMLTGSGTPVGVRDVWMTGYLDGACPPQAQECGTLGKVSYLGGHQFATSLPISSNPTSNGTRLFLNSLFEAPCATPAGHPFISVQSQAPVNVAVPQIDYTLDYMSFGPTVASNAVLVDTLPPGATFVSACCGGVLVGDEVVWDLGNLGIDEGGNVSFTVSLPDYGNYQNTARIDYDVGLTPFSVASNLSSTNYMPEASSSSGGTDEGTSGAVGDGSGGASMGEGGEGPASTTAATAGDGGLDGTAGPMSGSGGASAGGGTASGGAEGTGTNDTEDGTGAGSLGASDDASSGCGCRSTTPGAGLGWLLLVGLGLRRRRGR